MKKFIATVSTASVIMASLVPTVYGASESFVDIQNSYAKDAIVELQEMGIINGMDDTHFVPKGTVTRAQFTAIIVRALGLDVSDTTSSFADVKGWAVAAIEAAADAGIIQGVGNGLFAPNAALTREEAATILVRGLELHGALGEGGALNFKDAAKIAEWAKPYIALAQQYELVRGNPDGTFAPKATMTREMAATMGVNLLGALDNVEPVDQTPPVVTPPVVTPPTNTEQPPVVAPPVYYPPYTPPTNEPPVVIPPVDEADVTKPVIVLNGNATENVVNGDVYTDAGAMASDNKDGDISGNIVVTITNEAGDVITAIDTETAGTYTYHYNVGDAAGNAAVEVTRTIVVTSVVTPPTETDLTAYNAALAAVNEADYTAESWAAYQAVVEANVMTASNTQAEVNAATAAITAAQANLDVNPAAPVVVRDVYIKSNNVVDSVYYATVGDTITLTFTTDEEVSKLSNFKINGNNPDTFDSAQTGDNWTNTATYAIQESDPDGLVNFQINVKNAAGTYSVTTEATTDGSSVTVSKEAPIISGATIVPDGAERVMLQFQTNEAIDLGTAGNLVIRFLDINGEEVLKGGAPIVKSKAWSGYLTNYEGTVKYSAGDENNEAYVNVLPADTALYTVITSASSYADSEWYNAIATIQLEATDDIGNKSVSTVNMPAVNANLYVEAQDFGKIEPNVADSVYGSYNVGFKITVDALDYASIATVTATIYDGETVVGKVAANTPERIAKYEAADEEYGGTDGQLSFDFVTQDALDAAGISDGQSSYLEYTTPVLDEYMTGSELPTRATLEIVTKNGVIITVSYVYPQ